MIDLLILVTTGLGLLIAMHGILTRPKLFVLLGILLTVLSPTLVHLTRVEEVSYLDEFFVTLAVVILPVRRLLQRKKLRKLKEFAWISLLLAVGFSASLLNDVPAPIMTLGAALLVKWFLLSFAIAQLDWNGSDIERVLPLAGGMALLLIFSGLVNFLAPSVWGQVFAPGGVTEERFGLYSLIGPFTHPSDFATVMALLAIAVASYRNTVRKSGLTLFILCGAILASIFGFRRRLWLAMSLALVWIWSRGSARGSFIVSVLALAPLLVFFSADLIGGAAKQVADEYLSDSAELSTARTVMSLDSLKIAADNFPFGVGFGRFGGFTAALYYSPEYTKRGYEGIYGLSPEGWGNSNFLTDTFWPQVLGETGWLGTIAFVAALIVSWKRFRKLQNSASDKITKWIGVTGTGYLIFAVIDSLASPAFTGPMSVLLFSLIGISVSLEDQTRIPPQIPNRGAHLGVPKLSGPPT